MRLRVHVLVAGFFLGLVAFYTPLVRAVHGLQRLDSYNIVVMLTIFHNLLTQPRFLMEGPAFYPFGTSLTFMEPLLTPGLLMGPLAIVTGDPVIAFNLTLLAFWALSGWAMYATTFWLTGRHSAALVAALAFTVCPARLQYNAFQVQLMFGVPLAVYALVRFLEAQRTRHLVLLLVVFWLQAVAVVYYAVILSLGLAVVATQYVALRWRGWRLRTLVTGVGGVAILLGALSPIGWPYFVTHWELHFERTLADGTSFAYSADLLAYLTTRGTWLWPVVPIEGVAEAPLFFGVVVLMLLAVSLAMLLREGSRPSPWLARGIVLAGWVSLAVSVAAIAVGHRFRLGPVRAPFSAAGAGLLICMVARHAVEGWSRWRRHDDERRLSARDWVAVLWVLLIFAVLMSLGPIVHVGGRSLGRGLHAWLYPYVFLLRAIRLVTRFGALAMFAAALLAGFAAAWLQDRLPRPTRWIVSGLVPLLLLLEAASVPRAGPYPSVVPRLVDTVLRCEPHEGAVLEYPINEPGVDSDATLRSLTHGRRVVNGFAGFSIDLLQDLSNRLSTPGSPFPSTEAEIALRRIYALRYLVVRLADLAPAGRSQWLALRGAAPTLLKFRGTFGEEDLHELVPLPEEAVEVERLIPFDVLRRQPILHLTLQPLVADPLAKPSVEISLNDRTIGLVPLNGETSTTLPLTPPFWHVTPNVLSLRYRSTHIEAPGPQAAEPAGGRATAGFRLITLVLASR